jgi:hypothetical protein
MQFEYLVFVGTMDSRFGPGADRAVNELVTDGKTLRAAISVH